MNTRKLIGKRIKTIRKSRGITQERLADLIDVDAGYISKIEQGVNTPSIETFESLASVLKVDIKDFFDFEYLVTADLKEKIIQIFEKQSRDRQELLYKIAKAFEY